MIRHIGEDDLYRLAEKTNKLLPFTKEEERMLDHLEECRECYETFCAYCVVLETMSESSAGIIAQALRERNVAVSPIQAVLATIRVVTNTVRDAVSVTMEQLDQAVSELFFQPAFATVRGSTSDHSQYAKLDSLENEKTYVSYDAEKRCLKVRIDTSDLPEGNLSVVLLDEQGERHVLSASESGKILTVEADNLPYEAFTILIEQA